MDLSGRGTTRAEDVQATPTQSHISPSVLVYEEKQVDTAGTILSNLACFHYVACFNLACFHCFRGPQMRKSVFGDLEEGAVGVGLRVEG